MIEVKKAFFHEGVKIFPGTYEKLGGSYQFRGIDKRKFVTTRSGPVKNKSFCKACSVPVAAAGMAAFKKSMSRTNIVE